MRITAEFIQAHKPRNRSHSPRQIAALGIGCAGDWISRAVSVDLTDTQVAEFVRLSSREESRSDRREELRSLQQDKKRKPSKAERRAAARAERSGKPKTQAPKARKSSPDGVHIVEGVRVDSAAFLQTYAWATVRVQVLRHYGSRCMCCGASPADGAVMNVDHIRPRKTHPELALAFENLQVLCGLCNKGKGNWCDDDMRPAERVAELTPRDLIRHVRAIGGG